MPEACDALESINETLAQVPSFRPSPVHLALHIMNFPQRAPHLHHATPDHARVDRDGLFDQFLHGGAGIESHDEVVSRIIAPLILLDRLGQEEAAPVGDASDHSALSEDDGAGSPGDSGMMSILVSLLGEIGTRKGFLYSLTSATLPGRTCQEKDSLVVEERWGVILETHDGYHFIQHSSCVLLLMSNAHCHPKP